MATFVLIPGAWHGGWCWERVTPLLEAAGHRALAPDLLGTGADPTPPGAVTLDAWADQVAALVAAQPEPVVLVGHSRGGVMISQAAERVPERVRSLVYVAAALVRDQDALAAGQAYMQQYLEAHDAIATAPDGSTSLRAGAVHSLLYNATAPEWVARARACVGRDPWGVFTTPFRLSAARFGSVRRAYVECSEDRVLPLAVQRAMQDVLPCEPVVTLPTDHCPFYSAPEALAGALLTVDRASAGRG